MILDEIFEQSFRRSADDDLALTFAESVEDAVLRHHDDLAFVVTMATHIHLTLATTGGWKIRMEVQTRERAGRPKGGTTSSYMAPFLSWLKIGFHFLMLINGNGVNKRENITPSRENRGQSRDS